MLASFWARAAGGHVRSFQRHKGLSRGPGPSPLFRCKPDQHHCYLELSRLETKWLLRAGFSFLPLSLLPLLLLSFSSSFSLLSFFFSFSFFLFLLLLFLLHLLLPLLLSLPLLLLPLTFCLIFSPLLLLLHPQNKAASSAPGWCWVMVHTSQPPQGQSLYAHRLVDPTSEFSGKCRCLRLVVKEVNSKPVTSRSDITNK